MRRPLVRRLATVAAVVGVVASLGLVFGTAAARLARPACASEDAEERGEGVVLFGACGQLANRGRAQRQDSDGGL